MRLVPSLHGPTREVEQGMVCTHLAGVAANVGQEFVGVAPGVLTGTASARIGRCRWHVRSSGLHRLARSPILQSEGLRALSPGQRRSRRPGSRSFHAAQPEGLGASARSPSDCRVISVAYPGLRLRLPPWAEGSQSFGLKTAGVTPSPAPSRGPSSRGCGGRGGGGGTGVRRRRTRRPASRRPISPEATKAGEV